jgi:hypothetical protein
MNFMKSGLVMWLLVTPGLLTAQQKTEEINLADSTGMPGDNFSLEGALGLFKESETVEEFEKELNRKDNVVNNLDLNGDGKTDYVRVVADKKDDTHIFILQTPVNKTESQDIAVITLEKTGDRSAFIQIAGNEDIYGEEKIVEPKEEGEPADGGVNYKGPSVYSRGVPYIYFNVWFWPCVQFVYAPIYIGWVSPWYWNYYPVWWSPWPPYPWRYHYMHCHHYHHYYHPAYYHRSAYGPAIYAPRRTTSTVVVNRYTVNRNNYKAVMQSRPRPAVSTGTGRPANTGGQVKPSTRPVTVPAKPQSKPQTRPQTKPETQQPQSRPQTKPEMQQPQSRPQAKPETRPGSQQPPKQQLSPGQQPSGRPSTKPATKPPSGQTRPPQGAKK